MPLWYYTVLTVVNLLSLLGLFVMLKRTDAAQRRQMHILGEKNKSLIVDRVYAYTRVVYVVFVLALMIYSYFIIG